jgi:tetratricopeptide (TPR) repeat protein
MSVDAGKAVLELLKKGSMRQAASGAERLLRAQPDSAASWLVAAQVAQRTGSTGQAEQLLRRALELEPDNLPARTELAFCLAAGKQFAEALSLVKEIEDKVSSPDLLGRLGNACAAAQDFESAERLFRRAIERRTDNPELHFNLAAVQRYLGEISSAELNFMRAIALNPLHYEAIFARSNLRMATPEDNNIAELRERISRESADWRGRVMLQFALAKELEDLGEWRPSFDAYRAGATLQRRQTRYDAAGERAILDLIRCSHCCKWLIDKSEGQHDSSPIFILGLPRTGTTLAERILSAHSKVSSLGELNDFASALMQQTRRESGQARIDRKALVSLSKTLDAAALGKAYLAKVDRVPRSTPIFVDKMPLNFLYLGLICKALPDARVIHVVRSPMDACFAIFKTLFKGAYPWSYDLLELADYYIAYHRLMHHWLECLPHRIHQVRYEALTTDQRSVTEALLDASGLAWEECCMAFHELPTASTTASATQVREPMYTRSIGKWRHYEEELHPVYERLQQAGIDPEGGW